MRFLNYPSESPFQQHILSQFWTNLLVDVLNIGVKYRPLRYPNPRTLDLDRGGKEWQVQGDTLPTSQV